MKIIFQEHLREYITNLFIINTKNEWVKYVIEKL